MTGRHVPAVWHEVAWQFAGSAVNVEQKTTLARAEGRAYELAHRHPDARVWVSGFVLQEGRGFSEPAAPRAVP